MQGMRGGSSKRNALYGNCVIALPEIWDFRQKNNTSLISSTTKWFFWVSYCLYNVETHDPTIAAVHRARWAKDARRFYTRLQEIDDKVVRIWVLERSIKELSQGLQREVYETLNWNTDERLLPWTLAKKKKTIGNRHARRVKPMKALCA